MLHAMYGEFLAEGPDSVAAITQAVDEYRKALAIDPEQDEARFGLGVLFARIGMYGEARREWGWVLLKGDSPGAIRNARYSLARLRDKLQIDD
jgi:Flp pilus assembly protein TadD